MIIYPDNRKKGCCPVCGSPLIQDGTGAKICSNNECWQLQTIGAKIIDRLCGGQLNGYY